MRHILLLQLPIPQLNFGVKTGNVPLAAACLKQAGDSVDGIRIDILSEKTTSYLGDAALIKRVLSRKPDIIGFTLFNWNVERSIYMAQEIKKEYQPKIIFGGPEMTPDNRLAHSDMADLFIYGQGEAVFAGLFENQDEWKKGNQESRSDEIFRTSPSPYLKNLLEPDIDHLMYLETQRGCPYQCGFCYYHKSLDRMIIADEDTLLQAVRWAVEHQVGELCLLDPSLNTRPGLNAFLKKISLINRKNPLGINGELRADSINRENANLFAAAGFSGFEIGLQTTNPKALDIMKRPTSLKKFLKGVLLLKERGILPRIDLIAGLPGDDLDGFKKSVNFICDNDLCLDVQVFPLSILPGTNFKKQSRQLGLHYEKHPPYNIIRTAAFSQEDMFEAFDYAESMFDVSLFPEPDLNLSYRPLKGQRPKKVSDHTLRLNNKEYISKLILNSKRSLSGLARLADKVTHPYQVIIHRAVKDQAYICSVIEYLTTANPFTPVELIFLEPADLPDTVSLLQHAFLKRPGYLDNDLRFLYDAQGNRSMLFTLVSRNPFPRFYGEMKRQVYWWKQSRSPELNELKSLSDLSGILIDMPDATHELKAWQDRIAGKTDELLLVSFADPLLQKRWMAMTASDEYYLKIL